MIAFQQGWGAPMIHDLKPYPTTKGSGMPWLGEVPEPLDEEDAYQKMLSDATHLCFRRSPGGHLWPDRCVAPFLTF